MHVPDRRAEGVGPDEYAGGEKYQRGQIHTGVALIRLPRPQFRHRGRRRGRETVAVRGTCSGTHEGELFGILPTGNSFAAQQSHWFRVADGKVAEYWAVRGDLGMMKQLGIMPSLPVLFKRIRFYSRKLLSVAPDDALSPGVDGGLGTVCEV